MSYTTSLLTSVSDCDTLLDLANDEKSDLEFRKEGLERQNKQSSDNATDIDTDLQEVAAEIATSDTIIATFPDGKLKDEHIDKKRKLEYRQYLLTRRKGKTGAIALLEKENDLQRIEKEIDEVDAFISAVTERKAVI